MYLDTKINMHYIPKMLSNLDTIRQQYHIKQKSPEWLSARNNLISASEAGYLLGIKATSSIINYLKSKQLINFNII